MLDYIMDFSEEGLNRSRMAQFVEHTMRRIYRKPETVHEGIQEMLDVVLGIQDYPSLRKDSSTYGDIQQLVKEIASYQDTSVVTLFAFEEYDGSKLVMNFDVESDDDYKLNQKIDEIVTYVFDYHQLGIDLFDVSLAFVHPVLLVALLQAEPKRATKPYLLRMEPDNI